MYARIAALSLGVFIGCSTFGVDQDNYPDRIAAASCDFSQRCMAAAFYYTYDDADECIDEGMDAWEDAEDYYEDCDFDDGKATECLEAYASDCKTAGEDYEDIFEPCAEVWDCGGSSDDSGR